MHSTEEITRPGLSSRTKNALVITAIIGGILIGALLIYTILVTPARLPYRAALAQYENVNKANDTLTVSGAKFNSATASNADFEKSIKNAQQALASLRIENTALGKEDVLLTGKGKALYEPFNTKLQAYMSFNENTMASLLIVRPVLHDCSTSTSLEETQKSVTAARQCVEALRNLKNIPDKDYAQLVKAYETQYTQLADTLEKIIALKDPKGVDKAQHEVFVGQLKEITEGLSASGTEFSKNFQKHRSEVSPVGISNELEEYLKSQSRVF